MLITHMGSGPYHEWSLDGNVLTMADQTFDLERLSSDSQETIDVVVNDKFAANIILPAREYTFSENEESEPALKPLATDRIKLNLWNREE